MAELLDEVHAHAARQEGEDRVGLGGGDAGQLRRVIELAERHVHFVEGFAAELMLEAGGGVLAGLIVGHDHDYLLDPGILGVLAQDFVHLIVLVGGDEEVRVAILAGEARRSGVGTDEDDVRLGDRLLDRLQDVGKHRPDHEIDLVAIDQRLDLADGHVGLELVIGDDDLGLAAAELAAQRLHRQREAVTQLLAEHGGRARQRGDEADLEIVLGLRGGDRQSQCGSHGNERLESERLRLDHTGLPERFLQHSIERPGAGRPRRRASCAIF